MIRISSCRPVLHAAFAALVVVATGHCAWEGPAAVEQHASAVVHKAAGHTLPIVPHSGCHNESGCICRGTTLATSVEVSDCSAQPPTAEALAGDCRLDDQLACGKEWPARTHNERGVLSGREMRALMASLLL